LAVLHELVRRSDVFLTPLLQSGRLDVSGIFTDTMPLSDASAAYAAVAARTADCVKVALTM
jgi:threonine dehydrogenase-like Zn-dependent dehydrogenase